MLSTEQVEEYKIGDIVLYRPLEGRPYHSIGTIEEIVTEEPDNSSGPNANKPGKVLSTVSEENPFYYIKNATTSKTTLYRHTAIVERKNPPYYHQRK